MISRRDIDISADAASLGILCVRLDTHNQARIIKTTTGAKKGH